MRKTLLTTILALGILAAAPARADYKAGYDAYKSGDYATALAELRPLADQGNVDAQFLLGEMYYFGNGLPQDRTEAVRWYRAAAEQGDAEAQSDLGYAYAHGEGVEKNVAEAARWYRASADQGFSWGQSNLGTLYRDGAAVPKDYAEALRLFHAAADQGLAAAMSNIGYMYEQGLGVPQDLAEARRWYQAAADKGDSTGQQALQRLTQSASSNSASINTGSGAANGCAQIVGEWVWAVGGLVTATPEGGLSWRQNATAAPVPSGQWRCQAGTYTLAWNNGFVDTLRLSADGSTLSGTNQQGTPITGARVSQ